MEIKKVSPKSYQDLSSLDIEDYIRKHYSAIGDLIYNDKHKFLRECNKHQLNNIAAELETVRKRLEYIIKGIY